MTDVAHKSDAVDVAAARATPTAAARADGFSVQLGALVPLTRPGWVEAGRHLRAGLELAVRDVNDAGGSAGRPLELVVRDTAADPRRAAAAVDELAGLDALTEQPTESVARLAPAQSHGWRIYADFLLSAGRRRIALAGESGVYWASGTRILRDHLAARGASVIELDMRALALTAVCDELVDKRATALLLLVGHPEPAASIVRSVRRDRRLSEIMIGAPAGQPEFAPSSPSRATTRSPSWPTCCVLRARNGVAAPHCGRAFAVEGTRGHIQFSRTSNISVWQWAWPPIQVVDRDPAKPNRFRVLHAA